MSDPNHPQPRSPRALRLGVNIDHVATIRNARGGIHPDPVRAAEIVAAAGGDGLTVHLREDRRHIRDEDLSRIQSATGLPINLEMAATDEMRKRGGQPPLFSCRVSGEPAAPPPCPTRHGRAECL